MERIPIYSERSEKENEFEFFCRKSHLELGVISPSLYGLRLPCPLPRVFVTKAKSGL
jgi:hypothetical protein